jgi:hypothetical protein
MDTTEMRQVANEWARCIRVTICDSDGRPCRSFEQGKTGSFFYEFEILRDIEVPLAGLSITNEKGVIVHGKSTLEYGTEVPEGIRAGSRLRFRQDIALEIAIGEYTIEVGLGAISLTDYERRASYSLQELTARWIWLCSLPNVANFAVVFRRKADPVQLLHHGLANLPGKCRAYVVRALA